MNAVLSIEHIHLAYFEEPVLRDISFSVRQGEFFVIVGPNGSGKTSLLKAIAGTVYPSEGQVRLMNNSLARYSRKSLARSMAVVPQNPKQDFSFTVLEVVLMGRSPHLGLLGIENKYDIRIAYQAMESTQVAHLAERKMHQLSGGEQQRVFIARALCQEPQIILLDEPTSSLDLAHQVHIMDLLEELKFKHKITIVMVAHDLNLAALYGDRLLLLNKGEIAELGEPHQVLTFKKLEEVFECVLLVDETPLDRLPRISIIPGRYLDQELIEKCRKEEKIG